MTPAGIRASVVTERISWIRSMTSAIRNLPLGSFEEFVSDPRNVAAAESYLRRGIEALLDLGRHLLSKGFGVAVVEYKEVGARLVEMGVLSKEHEPLLRKIAGYRNRMVHFYHEVGQEELYALCTKNLADIETLLSVQVEWIRQNPDRIDQRI
jgi:uncharacterized protein YutE (UPF0331/DUF86 family)